MDTTRRPFTPDQVAAVWGCSPNHVRNLIHRGELRAFRLGQRLFRIPADAIEEYERQQMTGPAVTVQATTPLPVPVDEVIVLKHSRERTARTKA